VLERLSLEGEDMERLKEEVASLRITNTQLSLRSVVSREVSTGRG